MILYRTGNGWILRTEEGPLRMPAREAGALTTMEDLEGYLGSVAGGLAPADDGALAQLLPPIESQEVWAAGVTYSRSRAARMEEAQASGGGDFYDLVYTAERPELFFKAVPRRVVGPGQHVRIRSDAKWNVPEPEFTLLISPKGKILGYTLGNDMSSRDIEGANPLYLPQAKVYDGSCAIGPGILVTSEPLSPNTKIQIEIRRDGKTEFAGATALSEMKRDFRTLVDYLYRETSFPDGCLLMTGTGIVPPDEFTLHHGDDISITVEGIGTLQNTVA
jgi:2-dehydro-3-deoxy-D-arabinonate dehydratase